MERLKQRFEAASSALASLKELLTQPPASLVERDVAIPRFEYTVEAIWKAAQRHLDIREGLNAGSPKTAVRMCREVGLLDDEQAAQALEMMDDRNLTVHTYNERVAQQIYANLPRYAALLGQWLENMRARFDQGT